MLEFNNNHIFTGYLKQLLKECNLPQCKIRTPLQEYYSEIYGKPVDILPSKRYSTGSRLLFDIPYIYQNSIQRYFTESGWEQAYPLLNREKDFYADIDYRQNQKIYNLTKTFKIQNNIYDQYTHEYLGDYLRYLRDYFNLNLMSLYNCFNNKLCTNLNLTIHDNNNENKIAEFRSSDLNYKIYAIPVKLLQTYTIAIDATQIEVCCGIYKKTFCNKIPENSLIANKTYSKITNCRFSNPALYIRLAGRVALQNTEMADTEVTPIENLYTELGENGSLGEIAAKYEKDLKLFIKVPASCQSSIVILEGNYLKNTNNVCPIEQNKPDSAAKKLVVKQNKFIINFEVIGTEKENTLLNIFTPLGPVELLRFNTGVSYPFSNTLIEYLIGNTIDNTDEIGENIKRIQSIIGESSLAGKKDVKYPGLWADSYRLFLYDFMSNICPEKTDSLGYLDRKTESEYYYVDKQNEKHYFRAID